MIPFVAQSRQNTRGRLILFEQLYGRKTIISFIADDILRGLRASLSLGFGHHLYSCYEYQDHAFTTFLCTL